jgi:hypothetical protein
MDIAAAFWRSHPFVIKVVKYLKAIGLVDTRSERLAAESNDRSSA